jgi:hypothetical protein
LTISDAAPRSAVAPIVHPEPADLSTISIRELVTLLAQLEDQLRDLPVLVPRRQKMVVNPEVDRLTARQRAVIHQLRGRRVSWLSGEASARRPSSAAWPAPPWA